MHGGPRRTARQREAAQPVGRGAGWRGRVRNGSRGDSMAQRFPGNAARSSSHQRPTAGCRCAHRNAGGGSRRASCTASGWRRSKHSSLPCSFTTSFTTQTRSREQYESRLPSEHAAVATSETTGGACNCLPTAHMAAHRWSYKRTSEIESSCVVRSYGFSKPHLARSAHHVGLLCRRARSAGVRCAFAALASRSAGLTRAFPQCRRAALGCGARRAEPLRLHGCAPL